jgi:hypothetical protein
MRIVLFLSLLMPALWQAQSQSDADLPVEVVRFSWSKTRAADLPDSRPGSANQARREFDYLRDMSNRGSVEERSRALKELEEKTERESRPPESADLYRYRIELRNRGSKAVKMISVDYQTSLSSEPNNSTHRQFSCQVTIKPNHTKKIEAFSNLPPNRIVSAVNPDKPLSERVIINRIEFADGSVWQRPNWRIAEKIQSGARGQCRPI